MQNEYTRTEAVAQADAELSNAGLLTYTEMRAAFARIRKEAGPHAGNSEFPIGTIDRMAVEARRAYEASAS